MLRSCSCQLICRFITNNTLNCACLNGIHYCLEYRCVLHKVQTKFLTCPIGIHPSFSASFCFVLESSVYQISAPFRSCWNLSFHSLLSGNLMVKGLW
jgi:hypothetical protein